MWLSAVLIKIQFLSDSMQQRTILKVAITSLWSNDDLERRAMFVSFRLSVAHSESVLSPTSSFLGKKDYPGVRVTRYR